MYADYSRNIDNGFINLSLPGRQATENHTKNEETAMVLYFTGTGNSRYLAPVSYTHLDVYKRQSYGWAAIFTVGAWLVGGFLDGLLGSDTLGLNVLFAIIAMGCCIMKFIKDNNTQ